MKDTLTTLTQFRGIIILLQIYTRQSHIYRSLLRDCLRFAFMDVIQADLNRTMDSWNTHRIRAGVNGDNGIPDELYFLTEISGKNRLLKCLFCVWK